MKVTGLQEYLLKEVVWSKSARLGSRKGQKSQLRGLFYNTPARLKFLKTTATELQHIQQHIVQKSLGLIRTLVISFDSQSANAAQSVWRTGSENTHPAAFW